MNNEQASKIINVVDAGWHIVAVAVPTRALRLIRDELAMIFRVEQLNPKNWKWKPISTHAGDEAWESFGPGITEMMKMQARFKEKIKLARHNDNMARIKAENPTGVIH